VILPMTVTALHVLGVSVKRLETFLLLPEHPSRTILDSTSEYDAVLEFKNFQHQGSEAAPMSAKMMIPRGKLVGVVGPVGCGKTTFLSALVGDLISDNIHAAAQKRVMYAPQMPVIISGTVEENILFGRPKDPNSLEAAINFSNLQKDLRMLEAGLKTQIGERGTTLSGGQKQRLSLARAVYGLTTDSLLVVDDPISALDPEVGRQVMQNIINHNRGGGTAVVALNQEAYFRSCHLVYVLGPTGIVEERHQEQPVLPPISAVAAVGQRDDSDGAAMISSEVTHRGNVSSSVIGAYVRSMGLPLLTLCIANTVLGYVAMAFGDVWLAEWISDGGETEDSDDLGMRMGVYTGASLTLTFCLLVGSSLWCHGGARASRNLHQLTTERIMHAPMSWWESNTQGRIMSRFSADLSLVDLQVSFSADNAVNVATSLFAVVAVICIVVPEVVFVVVVAMGFYLVLTRAVDGINRDLKRMANDAMAPVLSNLAEVRQSQTLIRLMDSEMFFLQRHVQYMDEWARYQFASAASINFLRELAGLLASVISAAVCAWVLFVQEDPDPAKSGMVLTYSFLTPYFLTMVSGIYAMLKVLMTSVERLLDYLEVEQEPPRVVLDDAPESWPAKGTLQYDEVKMRYKPDLPLALKGVSFTIEGGQKAGVVGRTGSGKSSLMACLFRLVDPCDGCVRIDGVALGGIGLLRLRRAVMAIPQDPVLMKGTVRSNLDPWGEHGDAKVEAALLKTGFAHDDPQQLLNRAVDSSGAGFSSGEKQLMCFARALLVPRKILCLDEPTSNVDGDTDRGIQVMIKREFAACTMVTIAHRLDTVVTSDVVFVMSEGTLVESGPPEKLLASDGFFAAMWAAHKGQD